MSSTHHTGGDGQTLGSIEHTDKGDTIVPVQISLVSRAVILVVAVGTEFVTWYEDQPHEEAHMREMKREGGRFDQ